ncbi:hypothetical protein SpCBS45565_g04264 [Spizellomyces sp. 'palustris']|nr:hypothetical protein SpCBS45565_g04264 [Spizellomyces sp. 'palustris']
MASRSSTTRTVRRQASFASDDSAGAAASTASFRRRRDETLRKNAEKEVTKTSRPSTSKKPRPPTRTLSTTSKSTTSTRNPPSSITSPSEQKKPLQPPSPVCPPAPAPVRGTVSSMNPEPAVALHASAKVFEAAAYMAAKRQDAVLIVDGEGHLAGILTDKDLAYRVVADNLDPKITSVSQAMTANPVSVTTTSNATEALNKMVAGQFRHLPVVESEDELSDDSAGDRHIAPAETVKRASASSVEASTPRSPSGSGVGSGGVVGVLDITKCLYEALEKLDRAYESSRRLNEALEGVEREWSIRSGSIGRYAEALRDQLACPDLAGLLASQSSSPPVVGLRATVLDAARMMRESRETAVLVFDSDRQGHAGDLGSLAGIFTSKDLVLRVLAAGLDPAATMVVRVMTPHPDCVTPDTPVVDALRKMHAGRYLHLPVVDNVGVVEGMVDVLKLTYTTLTQMTNIQGEPGEGPVWNRFWDSTLSPPEIYDINENGSASASHSDHLSNFSRKYEEPFPDDSTVAPDDSASMFPARTNGLFSQKGIDGNGSNNSGSGVGTGFGTALSEGLYVFKLRDSRTGHMHRFTSPFHSIEVLQAAVAAKLSLPPAAAESLQLSFIDDEGDCVHLGTDKDILDAVLMARAGGWGRVVLSITGERDRREVEALNRVANKVFGEEGSGRQQRRGGDVGYLTPMLMGGGVALACAFLLGKAFK